MIPRCRILRAVGEFVDGVAFYAPGFAEADVGEADGAVDEEVGDAGEGEEAEEELEDDRWDGSAFLVDVGEDFGGHAVHGEGLDGAG
jgi:hypothetical protein